jgi:hypothetical protein
MNEFPSQAFPWLEVPIGCEGDIGISWGESEVVNPGVTQSEVLAIIEKIKEESKASFGGILI